MLTKYDHEMALNVQTACNLRAVLRSMTDIADRCGGRWDNPVLRMYAEQVIFLTGGIGDLASYREAYDAVEQRLKELEEAA